MSAPVPGTGRVVAGVRASRTRRSWITTPAEVAAAEPEALLTAVEVLTHRIHEATSSTQESDLRAQRDLVQAEILRRMGGAR